MSSVNAGVTLAVALATVSITFLIARRRGRYDTIDTAWGLGFAAIAITSCVFAGTGVVAALLTIIWGLRLSVHLHRRNRGEPEDRRYAEMARNAGSHPALRMFVRVYLAQALVMWFVSLPVQFAGGGFGIFTALRLAVWGAGFLFEVVGDEQLRRFRARPGNEGKVLDTGLWRYTRHPNYFGDACVWWGLYLIACQHWPGPLTAVSPVLMTWLLARGTGKPLLERSLRQRRPGYAAYVARTSGFFPLPPKRCDRDQASGCCATNRRYELTLRPGVDRGALRRLRPRGRTPGRRAGAAERIVLPNGGQHSD